MYEKILVTLDGSVLAETILPYVVKLATALEIPVDLLHTIEPEAISALANPEQGRPAEKVEADLRAHSLGYLSRIAASFPESLAGEHHVHVGRAADIIVEHAVQEEKTLVAMATHGRSGVKRMWLGSVADKVLHACSNPMILIRAREEGKTQEPIAISSIIVPLDGSAVAETVLPHAVHIAKALGIRVTLFRVYALAPTMYSAAAYPSLEIEREAKDRNREHIELYLSEKVDQLRAYGLRDVDYIAVQGDAASEIVDIAEKTKDNIVAMCTHGRSGVARWVVGSVTDRVVRQSGDAVLIVRAPAPA